MLNIKNKPHHATNSRRNNEIYFTHSTKGGEMNHIELTGFLAWAFVIIVGTTTVVMLLTGAYVLLQYIWWEILMRRAMTYTKAWQNFIRFSVYHKWFKKWYELHKDKTIDEL